METQDSNNANASEKLEEVQNELHCSICHDYFVQASTLSCSHSFCFNCINAWRQIHTDCPVCRREILGMAPSRALDNMVAALVDRTNSEATDQATLQQFGAWVNPAIAAQQPNSRSQSTNINQANQQVEDSDFDNQEEEEEEDEDWEDEEEEYESYSGGSYNAEEEEYEGEEEEDEEEGEEEEEEEDEESYNSDYDDEEEYSDDDEYEEHVKKSNENNPNNDEYWKSRGWSGRPDNWRELMHRQ